MKSYFCHFTPTDLDTFANGLEHWNYVNYYLFIINGDILNSDP